MGSSTSKLTFFLRSHFDLDKLNFRIFVRPKSKVKTHDKCVEIHVATCKRCDNSVRFHEDAEEKFQGVSIEAVPSLMPQVKSASLPPTRHSRRHQMARPNCHVSFSEAQANRRCCPRFIKDTKHIQCRFCKNEIDRIALLEFMRLERECEIQNNKEKDISKLGMTKSGLRIGEPLTHSTPLKSSPLPCRVVHFA